VTADESCRSRHQNILAQFNASMDCGMNQSFSSLEAVTAARSKRNS